jgi:ribosome-binding factor A
MSVRRVQRVSRQIRDVVSRMLLQELADPRLGFITVTGVEVSDDMRQATVLLSVLGESAEASKCLKAVGRARGRIQKEVNSVLTMRIVPRIDFQLDQSVKKSAEIARLIQLARSEYQQDVDNPPEAENQESPPEEAPRG